MSDAPDYFERIRAEASRRWDQLEADPDLAAPWHQLFRQVQSPRHVISELLQNADDAGARWARVRLTDDTFVFEHDGEDFDAVAFRSLCRFGFSNKRRLHTIGFRGIGFKSTFSVGPRVELRTPTLAVAFNRDRFTEPVWIGNGVDESGELRHGAPGDETGAWNDWGRKTQVRIRITDDEVRGWLAKEIRRWAADPLPILFFRSIHGLNLQGTAIAKRVEGPGPVPRSEWVHLQGMEDRRLLRVWSEEEPFPWDAMEEVRAERGDPDFELPPCRVEIVVGSPDARLYVILPTEVRCDLPFACNAPFMQDPARTGIKDPTGSATNRWLLRRTGGLAAEALGTWVHDEALPAEERAGAYAALLPAQKTVQVRSLAYDVEQTILDGLREGLSRRPVLLSAEGPVVRRALDLPSELLEVWPAEMSRALFGDGHPAVLHPAITRVGRSRLADWELLDRFDTRAFFERLQAAPRPPAPPTASLIHLWAYVYKLLSQERHRRITATQLALVPAVERDGLYPASEVVVSGGSAQRLRPQDWTFIGDLVPVADPEWARLMQDAREQDASEREHSVREQQDAPQSEELHPKLQDAVRLFGELKLADRSGLQHAVFKAARAVFEREDPGDDGVRIAYITARADLQPPDYFQFLCDDGAWHPVSEGLLYDAEDALSCFPVEWVQSRLVSAAYATSDDARDVAAWRTWAESTRSRLRQFILPSEVQGRFRSQKRAEAFIVERAGHKPKSYPLKSRTFVVSDFDFDDALWVGWESEATGDEEVWLAVVAGIIRDWDDTWRGRRTAHVRQMGNTYSHGLGHGELVAAWVHRLRGTRCLPDAEGQLRLPAELYRTNADTRHLAGVEPFLASDYDYEGAAEVLALLGVRDRPEGLGSLLSRLRALSGTAAPDEAVFSLYRALDRSAAHVPQSVLDEARKAFEDTPLILASDGGWYSSSAVFQQNDDKLPGLPVIAPDVASLRLWDRIGVARRPSTEAVIDWLKTLPKDAPLEASVREQLRTLLPQLPQRVWQEVGCWLDAAGRWARAERLTHSVADLHVLESLFEGVRQSTADLSMLPAGLRTRSPFEALQSLEAGLTYEPKSVVRVGGLELRPWLIVLGQGLLSALPEASVPDGVVRRRRTVAKRLAETKWQRATSIYAAPYLDGDPAGDPRTFDVLWSGSMLLATDEGPRVYQQLVAALSAPFEERALSRAIEDCAGRSAEWVADYFDAHFEQDPDAEATEGAGSAFDDDADGTDLTESPNGFETGDSEEHDDEGEREVTTRRRKRSRVSGALRIFFEAGGYRFVEPLNMFLRDEGGRVRRGSGPLPWEEYDANGMHVCSYWMSRTTLADGVVVPAEVWELAREGGEAAALLIPSPKGSLRRYTGDKLESMLQSRDVALFPASYRIRPTEDDE